MDLTHLTKERQFRLSLLIIIERTNREALGKPQAHRKNNMNKQKEINEEEINREDHIRETELWENSISGKCPYCRLSLDLHDGSGFCPGGTEEFGGRR